MLSPQQFTAQLLDLQDQYRADNAWVNRWAHWNDDAIMARFITFAYNLYAATATNRLKLTLLGGTEIRKDAELIQNFGVTGVNGIQDNVTRNIVYDEIWKRMDRLKNIRQDARRPDRSYANVANTGSILSEKGWTPILNDALIVGAITARQSLALALTPVEQEEWKTMNEQLDKEQEANQPLMKQGIGVKNRYLATMFDSESIKTRWKKFFNSQKFMFIDSGTGAPRVFTRELLGLSFSGYKPEFSPDHLGFSASGNNFLDFKTYLRKLRGVRFHEGGGANMEVMRAVSKFLFDDENAIGSPWSSDTKLGDGTYRDIIH